MMSMTTRKFPMPARRSRRIRTLAATVTLAEVGVLLVRQHGGFRATVTI